jgi:homocitrate synthase NifV
MVAPLIGYGPAANLDDSFRQRTFTDKLRSRFLLAFFVLDVSSAFNCFAGKHVRKAMLIDTTLREGEQRFGVYFSLNARKRIFLLLVALGVEEIELGWACPDKEIGAFFDWARDHAGGSKLSLWCRAREADLEIARSLSPDRVNVGLPLARGRHQVCGDSEQEDNFSGLIGRVLRHAARLGLNYVSVGLENAFRDRDRAFSAAGAALSHGAARIRLSDTPGRSTPMQVMETVAEFRKRFNILLAVHCHNDLGMASANAVCALANGAHYADVSVLGLGERAGIAATQQVVAYLCLENKSAAYRMDLLPRLCRLVAREAGETVNRTEPVVGSQLFHCESGLHVHGLDRDPELFFPFAPERVGTKIRIGLGKKSGRAAVARACASRDLFCSDAEVARLTQRVREVSATQRRPLTETEFRRLWRQSTSEASS